MRKQLILVTTLAMVALTNVQAKIWRVNNMPGVNANFMTLQAAHNGAKSGDTLYLEGSPTSYGGLKCSKGLFILGPGYFLNQNLNLQANSLEASVGTIDLDLGSSGTTLSGLSISDLNISSGNIVIRRNCIYGNINFVNSSSANIFITQNYINSGRIVNDLSSSISNLSISNNYINGSVFLSYNISAVISNNIIRSFLSVYNSTITNNIIFQDFVINSNNSYSNNISVAGASKTVGTANGNQSNVAVNSIGAVEANTFVVEPNVSSSDAKPFTDDSRWQLKPGSPLLTAGTGGTQVGIFGGSSPYVLSGIPTVPTITKLVLSATGSSSVPLNVTFSAKSNQ